MDPKNFIQGMSEEDALGFSESLNDGYEDVFLENYNSLSGRPDWDGILEEEEAMDWWHEGNGGALYVDLSKINFKSSFLSVEDLEVGKVQYVNFFNVFDTKLYEPETLWRPASDINLSHVFGTVGVILLDKNGTISLEGQGSSHIDIYNFNTLDSIAAFWSRRGTGFNQNDYYIYGYGVGQIHTKLFIKK